MKQIFLTAFLGLFFWSGTVGAEETVATETAAVEASPQVVIETTLGSFTLELYPDDAPATVENFLQYVDSGFYENTLFHRVIPGFMAQGGGFTKGMVQKATKNPVKNESMTGRSNERGTIAMARTNDPDSATSQFFVNVKDNWSLDAKGPQHGYTVFGAVTSGMDVVDKIVNVPTTSKNYFRDVPKEDVVILSTKRVE